MHFDKAPLLNLKNSKIFIDYLYRTRSFAGCENETGTYVNGGNGVFRLNGLMDPYFRNWFLSSETPKKCAIQCACIKDCIYWSYNTKLKWCWLFRYDNNEKPDTWWTKNGMKDTWITGNKACGLTSGYPRIEEIHKKSNFIEK